MPPLQDPRLRGDDINNPASKHWRRIFRARQGGFGGRAGSMAECHVTKRPTNPTQDGAKKTSQRAC